MTCLNPKRNFYSVHVLGYMALIKECERCHALSVFCNHPASQWPSFLYTVLHMAYLNIWDTIDQIVLLKAYKPNVISLLIFSRHAVHNSEISGQWRRNEFKSGGTCPSQSAGNFLSCPSISGLYEYNRFRERFRNSQFSLVSFLFSVLYSRCPRAQLFVNVGHMSPCHMESAPLKML